jgi:DNA primase
MGGAHRAPGSGQGGSRLAEAEFRRLVDELKERTRFSSAAASFVKLRKVGAEFEALCPFHNEKSASFTISDAKGFGHCFGCGWHGDVIRFVMDKLGCGFREAYRRLASADLPAFTPEERAKERAEDRLRDLAKEQAACQFFKDGVPIAGTPAEVYLRARGIEVELPPVVRFGMIPSWQDKETGEWGRARPALICGCEDGTGAIVGIQRIFFPRDDPTLGKADCKLSLGTVKGSALRLAPAGEVVILAEGPEDGFSIVQEGPGLPVWVPFGTSMMPAVQFPPVVRKVIIAGQNNRAGKVACNKAAIALLEQGLKVDFAWPARHFDDWNDQLRGGGQ